MFRATLTICIALATLGFATSDAKAGLQLVHEITISPPGITGTIHGIKFGDIDGDGTNEVLVNTDTAAVLFSLSRVDSAIASFSVAGYPIIHCTELADINRDHIADVLLFRADPIGDWQSFERSVTMYSGATGFADSSVMTWPQTSYFDALSVLDLCAVDIEGDGVNELIVSYDEFESNIAFGYDLVGTTEVFYSFPDSVIDVLGASIADIKLLPQSAPFPMLCHLYDFNLRDLHGPALTTSSTTIRHFDGLHVGPSLLHDDALSFSCPFPYFDTYFIEHGTYQSLKMAGDINAASDEFALLSTVTLFAYCGADEGDHYASRRELRLHQLHADSTVTKLWWTDIGYDSYDTFTFDVDRPGTFFGFKNDVLIQFDAETGAEIAVGSDAPEGTLLWHYPYGDDRLRLVALHGDQVSFYRIDITTAVDDHESGSDLPVTFVLDQPYPNPFNATVSIPLSVPSRGHLRLEVVNMLGRHVTTLSDTEVAAGAVTMRWQADNFPSGVYFIRATYGDRTESRKVILLK